MYECASVEGFWQGLKCKGDMRVYVFGLLGMRAKMAGKGKKIRTFEIGGQEIRYGSEEHGQLIPETSSA